MKTAHYPAVPLLGLGLPVVGPGMFTAELLSYRGPDATLMGPHRMIVVAAKLLGGKLPVRLVAGRASGREGDDQITLFKSVGTAVQDVTAGYAVYQEARRLGIGSEVPDFLELKTF